MVTVSPTSAAIALDGADLSDWDDEELLRGTKRNAAGGWTGRKPRFVPAALHKELTRRRFSRAFDLLAESLVDAAQMLRVIVNDSNATNADRIKAAEVIFDRVAGKPKEQVHVDLSGDASPFQKLVAAAIVGTDEQARELLSGNVEEAEILDDTAELEEEAEWVQDDKPSTAAISGD